MKIDEKYDYIICGGGATGLLLSHSLISDSFFDNKKVLVIEKEIKIENDRTFSFWDNQKNILDKIVFKSWGKAEFKDMEFSSSFSLKPYKYKMVRSDKFYSFMRSNHFIFIWFKTKRAIKFHVFKFSLAP